MKKVRNEFIKSLYYLCLIGVIALGLMTIIGTGGGGGGKLLVVRWRFFCLGI